jgi:hypothetical protein
MTDAIEGRWHLDFTEQLPVSPGGNDVILSNGIVTIARTGARSGSYRIGAGALTIVMPLPSFEREPPLRIQATMLLPDPDNPQEQLVGIIEAFDGSDAVIMREACTLTRRRANA